MPRVSFSTSAFLGMSSAGLATNWLSVSFSLLFQQKTNLGLGLSSVFYLGLDWFATRSVLYVEIVLVSLKADVWKNCGDMGG